MYRLHSPVHLLPQLVSECTDRYRLHSPIHMTGYRVYRLVLATQPCTLASTTGYRVYRLVLATQPCTLASTTGYRVYRLVVATQPCTLASTTGYRLQSVPAGTGYTALYTCLNSLVHLLQQLVTKCTGWYWLHSLVHLLQPIGYKSTNRVLATQSLLNSASTQLVTKKKKKKLAKYRPVAVNRLVTPACQFFAGYRELLVTVKYRVWSPGTGQSCLRLIWLKRILRPVSGLGDVT